MVGGQKLDGRPDLWWQTLCLVISSIIQCFALEFACANYMEKFCIYGVRWPLSSNFSKHAESR